MNHTLFVFAVCAAFFAVASAGVYNNKKSHVTTTEDRMAVGYYLAADGKTVDVLVLYYAGACQFGSWYGKSTAAEDTGVYVGFECMPHGKVMYSEYGNAVSGKGCPASQRGKYVYQDSETARNTPVAGPASTQYITCTIPGNPNSPVDLGTDLDHADYFTHFTVHRDNAGTGPAVAKVYVRTGICRAVDVLGQTFTACHPYNNTYNAANPTCTAYTSTALGLCNRSPDNTSSVSFETAIRSDGQTVPIATITETDWDNFLPWFIVSLLGLVWILSLYLGVFVQGPVSIANSEDDP
jgi:hypothetical protein